MYLKLCVGIPAADLDGRHQKLKFNEAPSMASLALASLSFCFSETTSSFAGMENFTCQDRRSTFNVQRRSIYTVRTATGIKTVPWMAIPLSALPSMSAIAWVFWDYLFHPSASLSDHLRPGHHDNQQ